MQTARMFGSGLNSITTGGLLLRCHAPTAAVVSGPSAHSIYLGESEFTVDPSMVEDLQVIERYPQSTAFKSAPQF
jgi:hypothetical protein